MSYICLRWDVLLFSFPFLCLSMLKHTLCVIIDFGYQHSRTYSEWSSLDPIPQSHILKITLGLETGHGFLLGISGTEIKWHHWLGIKKNVDEPTAIGEHIPRRRKLLIRCSICGLILSPCTLRWRDLHKTWRNLPGRSHPQCIKDPARCMYRRHVITQEVYSPQKQYVSNCDIWIKLKGSFGSF